MVPHRMLFGNMLREIILFGIYLVGVCGDESWCKATPQAGLPAYGRCLPVDQAMARYVVQVAPLAAFGLEVKSDVKIILEGSNGRRTKPISIASVTRGTSKQVTAERVDVSNPEVVHAYITSPTSWSCRQLTVWKDFRYWIFDCGEALSPLSPEASFTLSGSKIYELSILTGTDLKGGVHPRARISLIGSSRSSGPKVLEGSFPPGSNRAIRLQAADVGELQAIVLSNDSAAAPWFCKHITVRSEGKAATFKVGKWVGVPYPSSVYVPRYPTGLELTPQDIDCHTRAADVFEGHPGAAAAAARVHCPTNCQASEFAHTQGASLHPALSSICTAAILDGLLTPSGGDLVLTAVGPVDQYTGTAYNGIDSVDFAYSVDRKQYSFHMYLVDSVDLIETSVRIVDEYGKLSSVGRLEVKTGEVWGSVCNKGDYLTFAPQSAVKACQEFGFKTGVQLVEGCKDVEGAVLCADKGYPVASTGISCKGNEAMLADCPAEPPTATCLKHDDDVVVKCTNRLSGVAPEPGTIRIVGPTGTPAQSGIGRLQFYENGFGSVCSDGWSLQSEQVACRQMGYSNVKDKGPGNESCTSIMGQNYCGTEREKIAAVNFACTGREASLNQCPHAVGDDIYCVHDEDVVIACEGDGDPSGVGAFHKEEAAVQKKRFLSLVHLTCFDTLETKSGLAGPPGTMRLVVCPPSCESAGGDLKGAFIYTASSAVCRAAIHSGTITKDGGECLLVVGHGQHHFSSLESHGLHSEENGPYPQSFTTARVDHSVHSLLVTSRGPPLLQTASGPGAPQQPATFEISQTMPAAVQSAATGTQQPSGGAAAAGVPAAAASSAAPAASPSGAAAAAPAVAAGKATGTPLAAAAGVQVQQQAAATQSAAAAKPAGISVHSPRGNFLQRRGPAKRRDSTTLRRVNTTLHNDWVSYGGLSGSEQQFVAGSSSSRALSAGDQLSASTPPAGPYSRMIELHATPASQPEDIFHWFPPDGFRGFHGKPSDFVDVSSLAEGSLVSTIRDFTVIVRAAVTGGLGQWRTLLAHSDCEGFSLVVDPNDELIFEQTCHPYQVKSGFKPKLGERFDAAATFSTTKRLICVFVNGKSVASEKADFDINLRGKMIIGRASAAEADYFEGDILGVKLFNQEVPIATIQKAFSAEALAAHVPEVPSESRRTDDGRLCLSACSPQRPAWAAAAAAAAIPAKHAVYLSCSDSLRRPEFNGHIGQKILAHCPPDCLQGIAPLEGCRYYTSKSSVCKAGLHAGAVPKEGGNLLVTLAAGRASYDASQGHFGINSTPSRNPELRSFSVEPAPLFQTLACDANGIFTLKLGLGERELVLCPAGCAASTNAHVYGSGFYSPISSVCRAAMHAGALTNGGGEVELFASDARPKFAGSEMNGIKSESSGGYIRSFVFVVASPASSTRSSSSSGTG